MSIHVDLHHKSVRDRRFFLKALDGLCPVDMETATEDVVHRHKRHFA
jgi:hypothetical protein